VDWLNGGMIYKQLTRARDQRWLGVFNYQQGKTPSRNPKLLVFPLHVNKIIVLSDAPILYFCLPRVRGYAAPDGKTTKTKMDVCLKV